jgi:hypothetical protein
MAPLVESQKPWNYCLNIQGEARWLLMCLTDVPPRRLIVERLGVEMVRDASVKTIIPKVACISIIHFVLNKKSLRAKY